MSGSVICEACGAKVRDSHVRCPRCRAFLPKPEPKVLRRATTAQKGDSEKSGAPKIAAIALGLVGAVVAVVWLTQGEPAPTAAVATPADPLAARRARGVTSPSAPQGDLQPGVIPPDPVFVLPPQLALGSGDNDTEALARFRTAAERSPEDPQPFYDIGRALMRLGRPQEALGPLQRAIELAGDQWRFAFMHSYACALSQRWPDAVGGFRRAKSLMPNDAVTSYDLALALQKLTDYPGAVQEYNAAVQLDPSGALPRLGLAISLDRSGNAAEALAAYQQAARLLPEGADADRVNARIAKLGG